MNSKARKIVQIAVMTALFLISFIAFMFLTFPYEVLKEQIAAQISKASGYTVQIGDMSAAFPLGVKADNIHVETPSGGATLDLKGLRVRLGIFGFVLGRLNLTIEAMAGKGEMDVSVSFGLFDLAAGKPVPRRLGVEAKNFPLDGFASFALNAAATSPTANQMIAPLLSAIGFSGSLSGAADFALDAKNPTQSTGQADLQLLNAVLKLSHPSLGLPDQRFKKALLKAKVENGSVVIDKSSGFVADELELLADGKITLKPQTNLSLLDLKIIFRLNKGLKEKFGFIVDALTGSAASDGQLTMQVRGSMEQPAVTTF